MKGLGRGDCRSYPKGPDSSKLGLVSVAPQFLAPLLCDRPGAPLETLYKLLGCEFTKGVV